MQSKYKALQKKTSSIESPLTLTCIVSCFFLSSKSQCLIDVRSVSEDGGEIFFFCKNNINKIELGWSSQCTSLMIWERSNRSGRRWPHLVQTNPIDSFVMRLTLGLMTASHTFSIKHCYWGQWCCYFRMHINQHILSLNIIIAARNLNVIASNKSSFKLYASINFRHSWCLSWTQMFLLYTEHNNTENYNILSHPGWMLQNHQF